MKHWLFALAIGLVSLQGSAQSYSASSVFAHNDYEQPIPFYAAYHLQVGYIEADVFLQDGRLLVAHSRKEIDAKRTLDSLYLKPLQKNIRHHNGFAYADKQKPLTLMIDFKTEGISTMQALVELLKRYPELIQANNLKVVISGNVPEPSLWNQFPSFIHFDGRPGIAYTPAQLERVELISVSFPVPWNGKGVPDAGDMKKISAIRDEVHGKGKKLRFWGAPDFTNAWIQLMKLNIDVIGSDRINDLVNFIAGIPKNTYTNKTFHQIYQPTHAHDRTAKPKNIILLIGDGTGLTQLFSGYSANHGKMNLFGVKDIGFSLTAASDSYITDSAAGATAIATGSKTNNRFVGVDSAGNKLIPVTDLLKQKKFKTAIISNGDITDATPAAFYAHQPERSFSEPIALDFLASDNDILIGGGVAAFKRRKDNRDLFAELSRKGYATAESFNSLETIKNEKFVLLDDTAVRSKIDGRGDFLTLSLRKTLSTFSKTRAPFFIMLEGGQIDSGGHYNDLEYVIREVLDFDQVIGEAMQFVDVNKETLLIVTADHETGGLSLLDGNLKQGYVQGNFSTNDHTPLMVPVFAYGPGSSAFTGVYPNTDVFKKIIQLLSGK
jgi:alkaline phosphatase